MILKLDYELLNHPYKNEPSSVFERWAKIKLILIDSTKNFIKPIVDIQWDILVLLNWLLEHEHAIKNESFSDKNDNYSIGRKIFAFYNELDTDAVDENLIDKIYNYRTRHGIRFALRGTDINDIYIGLLNGNATISLCNKTDDWNYEIDIVDFFNSVYTINVQISQ